MKFAWVLVPALLVVGSAANAGRTPLDHAEFRDIYRELVEIDTSLSADNCIGAARAMAARLRSAGFDESDIHLIAPADRPTKGNLVAVLHGSLRGTKAILLLAHIDVVEAKRADWTRPPFTLIEEHGFFYGRGTADDKAMAAIFVDAMVRFKRTGYRPARDVKLALTCGEETPDDFDGAEFLVQHHRDLIDAGFAINEGGGGHLNHGGQRLYNGVEAAQKTPQDYRLEVTSPGGHSSRPVPDNAIYRLAEGLARLSKYRFPVQFNDVTRTYFARMTDIVDAETAADMRAILQTPPDHDALTRIAAHPSYNAILRTTCVATMLDGGHAPNALPQRAGANVNCRIFPGSTQEEIRGMLERVVGDPAITVTFVAPPRPISAPPPLTNAILRPIERVTQETCPGIPVIPTMLAGATDGRFLTPNGIPTYGVSGIFADAAKKNAHGVNECIGVQALYEARDFLDALIHAYAEAR